jgi:uncharacterized protein (DUF1919 family)
MERRIFNFNRGSELTTMGATWFVSFAYYAYIDKMHNNWKLVKTYPNRSNVFGNTKMHHKYWLEKVIEKGDDKLNTNKICLKAKDIKLMTKKLLMAWVEKTL